MPIPRYLQDVADGLDLLPGRLDAAAKGFDALADGIGRAIDASPATAPASFAPPPGTLFGPSGQPISTGAGGVAPASLGSGGGSGTGGRFRIVGSPTVRSFTGGPPLRLADLEAHGAPTDFGGGPFDDAPRPGWIFGGHGYFDPRHADRAPRLSGASGGGGGGGGGSIDRQVAGLTESARLAGGINRDFTTPRPGTAASSAAVVSELRTVGRTLGAKLDAIRGDLVFRESVPTARRRFG